MLKALKTSIPEFAKDIKINLGKVLESEEAKDMNQAQTWMVALSCAYATQHEPLIEQLEALAKTHLQENMLQAAKACASIMSMNNVYYRFVHLSEDNAYAQLPANLRMQVIGSPGVEKTDFELMSLAVSAINGCGMCIKAHVATLEKENVAPQTIQHAVRVAAVIQACAQSMTIQA